MSLSEKQIIRMMREEYEAHLRNVILELDEKPSDGMSRSKRNAVEDPGNTKKDEKPKDKEPRVKLDKLAVPTRVTHHPKGGPRGYEYTVVLIKNDEVTLSSGDGKQIKVSREELEKDYVVD